MESLDTNQVRVVLPGDLNDRNCLFGGILMKWMDEAAYISAMAYAENDVVTISADKIKFLKPAYLGNIIHLKAKALKSNGLKIFVHLSAFASADKANTWTMIAESDFCFAAVDKDNNPKRHKIKPG